MKQRLDRTEAIAAAVNAISSLSEDAYDILTKIWQYDPDAIGGMGSSWGWRVVWTQQVGTNSDHHRDIRHVAVRGLLNETIERPNDTMISTDSNYPLYA